MIRIVVADDHLFYRQGIRSLLAGRDDIEIVGEAADGEEALTVVATTEPDVLLLDVRMPGLDGIAVCNRLRTEQPTCSIVMVTMFDDRDTVTDALRAGATGYVLKDASVDELARAVHAAHADQGIFSPAVARTLAGLVDPDARTSRPGQLTDREAQILRCVSEGSSNEQIAERLRITAKTVRNTLSVVYTKIGVLDRSQAALWARDNLRT